MHSAPTRTTTAGHSATDAAINDDLLESGVPLPEGAVTPAALGLPDGGIEEVYYAALAQQRTASAGTGGGCGSGAGRCRRLLGAAGRRSRGTRARPRRSEHDAAACGRGCPRACPAARPWNGPGRLAALGATTLAGPTIPWRRVLGSAVRRAIAHAAGCHDYAYHRPARRRIPRIVLPAMRRPLVTVAVVVDTSGSMGQAELDAALTEIKGVIRAAGLGTGRLLVLACDAEVGAASRVRRIDDVRLVGGGGTDMRVGIAAAETSQPRPDVVVVLTDGLTPWPERPGRARLVIALIGGAAAAQSVPAWATTVLVGAAA